MFNLSISKSEPALAVISYGTTIRFEIGSKNSCTLHYFYRVMFLVGIL